MKRAIAFFLFAALTMTLFAACAGKKPDETAAGGTGTYADYIDSGKVFAAQIGDVYGAVANDIFKAEAVQEFTLAPDMLEAVRLDKVDAAILDDAYVKQIQDSGQYPDLDYLPVPKDVFVNMASNVFHSEGLRDQFNAWFATIAEDGTFDEIYSRWIGVSLPDETDIPRFELTGENGTLKVCNTGSFPPFSYVDSNNQPVGFDEEILSRFAAHLRMDIEYNMMAYDAVIPYVLSGKADMSGCSFTVTDERSDGIIFGTAYAKAMAMLVIKKSGAKPLSLSDFAGKDIGVLTGAITHEILEKTGGNPVYYPNNAAAAEGVRLGRVAGYMHALTTVQVMAAQMDGFEAIPVPKEIFSAQIGAMAHDQATVDRFNTFLATIEADGTLAEMQSRWFGKGIDLDAPIPEIQSSGENGTLDIAICSDSIPYVFSTSNGEYSGYSIELVLRFGAHEGKTVQFTDMAFGGTIPYIVSKKADLAIANIAITEERKKSVLFTDSIYEDCGGIIALKPSAVVADTRDHTSLAGKRIGVITGAFFDEIVKTKLNATPVYYQDDIIALDDVESGRIDGVMYDRSTALVINSHPDNEIFEIITVPEELHSGPMGVISMDQEKIDRFNAFLRVIEADGTLAEMHRRWIEENPGSDPPMPEIPSSGENGVITIATTGLTLPFSYTAADDELKGFCIEIALRFAAYEGKTVQFTTVGFDGLIQYVASGKADYGIDSTSITEERKKNVLFTEPYYYDRVGVMVLKQTDAPGGAAVEPEEGVGFIDRLKTGIERNLLTDNRWKMIVSGLGVTMTIAVLAQILGTVFGCFVCWLLMRKNRFVKWIGNLYCGLIYGTPIVVLLMIAYYIIFGNTSISNVLVAVFAFTMITGAGVATTLQGAIETVDPVEIEAARSIGFTAFKAFRAVTLPQAVKRALPGYTNGFVELVKATAIVGYIAIQDLTRAGNIIRSRTYDAYFPLLFVAVIYLIVTTICVQAFKFIVKKINGETDRPRRRQRTGTTALDYRTMRTKIGGDITVTQEAERGDDR